MAEDAYAYAKDIKDKNLQDQLNFSLSDLLYDNDLAILSKNKLVAKTIAPLFDLLKVDAGLDGDELVNYTKAIAAFESEGTETNASDSTSVANNMNLKEVFSQLTELLTETLDPSFAKFERKDPSFHDAYTNARSIKNLGARHDPTTPIVA